MNIIGIALSSAIVAILTVSLGFFYMGPVEPTHEVASEWVETSDLLKCYHENQTILTATRYERHGLFRWVDELGHFVTPYNLQCIVYEVE